MANGQELGVIGRTYEGDAPVIYKLVDELPDQRTRASLPWLTIISWEYDGQANNGMPTDDVLEQMKDLEKAITDAPIKDGLCRHAYSRTGNGVKELVYYVSDRDLFMAAFNTALRDHPQYPLEIAFHSDPQWDDFRKLLQAFRKSENR